MRNKARPWAGLLLPVAARTPPVGVAVGEGPTVEPPTPPETTLKGSQALVDPVNKAVLSLV